MNAPSSYSKYKYEHLDAIGVSVDGGDIFEKEIVPITPNTVLVGLISLYEKYPMGTEKARSEMFVFPVLTAIQQLNEEFTIFSGYLFDVDKSMGLKGHCDFLLSKTPNARNIKAPVIAVVEAKNDNVDEGVPQCVAEMLAAQLFNQKRGESIMVIHGIVTSGTEWLFLRLDENKKVITNNRRFAIANLDELLGALQTIIDFYKD